MAIKRPQLKIKEDWAKREWRDILGDAKSAEEESTRALMGIESELANPTVVEFGGYMVGCRRLAEAFAKLAIREFNESRIDAGWNYISDVLVFKLTEFKIAYAMRFPFKYTGIMADAALMFATSLALKQREVGEWTARFILETEADPKSKMRPPDPNEFECLCYQFAAEVCGFSSKSVWRDTIQESFYAPLWNADSLEEAQAALGPVAVARAMLCFESFSDYPPFEWPPFNLFPIDILAILLMRHSDSIEFDFGCLESPLCHPPVELRWQKPGIVERIESRVREKYEFPTVDWK